MWREGTLIAEVSACWVLNHALVACKRHIQPPTTGYEPQNELVITLGKMISNNI